MNVTPDGRHHRHLAVVEEHDVAGVREDRRDVGGDEVLALAEADDQRRAVPRGDERARVVGRQQHDREQPAQLRERAPHGRLEPVAAHLALHQVRDDLGVGLGDEPVALLLAARALSCR